MTYPASPGGRKVVDRWLTSLPGGEPLVEGVAVAPVLSTESFTPGTAELHDLWGSGAWVSWWGGPAVDSSDDWPAAEDGTPLAHVITVHLGELAGTVHPAERAAWGAAYGPGLPEQGVLEVFSDLRPAEPAARRTGMVRWVPAPSLHLQDPPLKAQPDGTWCGLWLTGFTVPAPSDYDTAETASAAEATWRAFDEAWVGPLTTRRDGDELASFAYGRSRAGRRAIDLDLTAALPLQAGDEHLLLLSLRPPLEGWLPRDSVLEVWTRRNDLVTGQLDAAWCVLRRLVD